MCQSTQDALKTTEISHKLQLAVWNCVEGNKIIVKPEASGTHHGQRLISRENVRGTYTQHRNPLTVTYPLSWDWLEAFDIHQAIRSGTVHRR